MRSAVVLRSLDLHENYQELDVNLGTVHQPINNNPTISLSTPWIRYSSNLSNSPEPRTCQPRASALSLSLGF